MTSRGPPPVPPPRGKHPPSPDQDGDHLVSPHNSQISPSASSSQSPPSSQQPVLSPVLSPALSTTLQANPSLDVPILSRNRVDSLFDPASPPTTPEKFRKVNRPATDTLKAVGQYYADPINMDRLFTFLETLLQCRNFDELRRLMMLLFLTLPQLSSSSSPSSSTLSSSPFCDRLCHVLSHHTLLRVACDRENVLELAIDRFRECSHTDPLFKVYTSIIVSLGVHSTSVRNLRRIFHILNTDTSPHHLDAILRILHSLSTKDGPDVFFHLDDSNDGFRLPSIKDWPSKAGWSACAWVRIEILRFSRSNENRLHVFSLCDDVGSGVHVYFAQHRLVVEISVPNATHSVTSHTTFDDGRWYFISVAHRPALLRKDVLEITVNGVTEDTQPLPLPSSLPNVMACGRLGGRAMPFQTIPRYFVGELGPIVVFDCAVAAPTFAEIFQIGPSFFLNFSSERSFSAVHDHLTSTISTPRHPLSITNLVGKKVPELATLSKKILLCLHPLIRDRTSPNRMFVSNSASTKISTKFITADSDIYHVTTQSVKDSLHSMCGIEALFPIFSLLEEYSQAMTGTGSAFLPSGSSGIRGCALLAQVIADFLNANATHQSRFQSIGGFGLISYILQTMSGDILDSVSLFSLLGIRHMALTPDLQNQLLQHIVFNPSLWVRSVDSVVMEAIGIAVAMTKECPDCVRTAVDILWFLDKVRDSSPPTSDRPAPLSPDILTSILPQWVQPVVPPATVITAPSILKTTEWLKDLFWTKTQITQGLTPTRSTSSNRILEKLVEGSEIARKDRFSRNILYSVIRVLAMEGSGLTSEETMTILRHIHETPILEHVIDGLNFFIDCVTSRHSSVITTLTGVLESIVVLAQKEDSQVRALVVKLSCQLYSLCSSPTTNKKKSQKSDRIEDAILLLTSLARGTVVDVDVFDFIAEQCLCSKHTGKDLDLRMFCDNIETLLRVTFELLSFAPLSTRVSVLSTLMPVMVHNANNREVLSSSYGWRHWLFMCLKPVPIEDQSPSSADNLEILNELVIDILRLVVEAKIEMKGGWNVLSEILSFVRISGCYQVVEPHAFTTRILTRLFQTLAPRVRTHVDKFSASDPFWGNMVQIAIIVEEFVIGRRYEEPDAEYLQLFEQMEGNSVSRYNSSTSATPGPPSTPVMESPPHDFVDVQEVVSREGLGDEEGGDEIGEDGVRLSRPVSGTGQLVTHTDDLAVDGEQDVVVISSFLELMDPLFVKSTISKPCLDYLQGPVVDHGSLILLFVRLLIFSVGLPHQSELIVTNISRVKELLLSTDRIIDFDSNYSRPDPTESPRATSKALQEQLAEAYTLLYISNFLFTVLLEDIAQHTHAGSAFHNELLRWRRNSSKKLLSPTELSTTPARSRVEPLPEDPKEANDEKKTETEPDAVATPPSVDLPPTPPPRRSPWPVTRPVLTASPSPMHIAVATMLREILRRKRNLLLPFLVDPAGVRVLELPIQSITTTAPILEFILDMWSAEWRAVWGGPLVQDGVAKGAKDEERILKKMVLDRSKQLREYFISLTSSRRGESKRISNFLVVGEQKASEMVTTERLRREKKVLEDSIHEQTMAKQWRSIMKRMTDVRGPWHDPAEKSVWKIENCVSGTRARTKLSHDNNRHQWHHKIVRGKKTWTGSGRMSTISAADRIEDLEEPVSDQVRELNRVLVNSGSLNSINLEPLAEKTSPDVTTEDSGPILREQLDGASFPCQWLRHNHVVYGFLTFDSTNTFLVFRPDLTSLRNTRTATCGIFETDPLKSRSKYRQWNLSAVIDIHRRLHLLRRSALELTFNDDSSAFFNFSELDCRRVWRILTAGSQLQTLLQFDTYTPWRAFRKSGITQKWVDGEMSNFEYLMAINKYAGRTFADLTQYPVFPWVITEYEGQDIDLSDPSVYRDLTKPIGALNPARLAKFKERMVAFEGGDIPTFLYGTHYSNMGSVLFFLLRLEPYTSMVLELQSGRFDAADRSFFSVAQAWNSCMNSSTDVRELIPEFFCLPEMFSNVNGIDIGPLQNEEHSVDDVILPPWAHNSPERFVRIQRQALESEFVSRNLHHWIDLIFGCKQRGEEAKKADNLFYYLTYEGAVNLETLTDDVTRAAVESQIANFGQTPSQLFLEPHPQRQKLVPKGALDWKSLKFLRTFRPVKAATSVEQPVSVAAADEKDALVCVCVHQGHVTLVSRDLQVRVIPMTMASLEKSETSDGSWTEASLLGEDVTNECLDAHVPTSALHTHTAQSVVAFQSDLGTSIFASGFCDKSILLWSPRAERISLRGCKGLVTALAWCDSKNVLAAGNADATVAVWKMSRPSGAPQLLCTLCGHESAITSVAINGDMDVCVSGSKDGMVLVHSIRKAKLLHSLAIPLPGSIVAVAVSKTGHIVVCLEYSIHLFSINATFLASVTSAGSVGGVWCVGDGRYAYVAEGRKLVVVDLHNKLKPCGSMLSPSTISSVSLTPPFLFCGCSDGKVAVFKVQLCHAGG